MFDNDPVPAAMSPEQTANLVRENVERLTDDEGLGSWLPEVVADVSSVEVGILRCPAGSFCENADLWETALNPSPEYGEWAPECICCNRKGVLVEVLGCFDFSVYV
jgi:hypothetical protein